MFQKTKKLLKKLLFRFYIYTVDKYNYHNLSFSQEGEDRILARIFERQEEGFYVDIGAHHPQRFSNTYLFYLKGWRGINIDAMPDSMIVFNKLRRSDINLELGISEFHEKLTYYTFSESALNSFSLPVVESYIKLGIPIISKQIIETSTLSKILDQYLPRYQSIDFLSIDVEGLDYSVLKSNDWEKYRPKVVLVEVLSSNESLTLLNNSQLVVFMRENHYEIFCKTVNTLIFKDILICQEKL